MNHIKITIPVTNQEVADVLTALLSAENYEGFEYTDHELLAYINEAEFDEAALKDIAVAQQVTYSMETVAAQNWNAVWEANFEPVVVAGFCTVRADFHDIAVSTPYEIVITPKMSFGTGHHATTQLMMDMMRNISLDGATVLDFGTGTGVLAILAEMLGAEDILAIDNDEWSVENARENIQRNNCVKIAVSQGSLEDAPRDQQYDVILANINRHILLHYMAQLYSMLVPKGAMLMSGLLQEDEQIITEAAVAAGFQPIDTQHQGNWIAIEFMKP